MKQLLAAAALLAALLAGPGPAWSADSLLTLVFSANSEGAVRQCPVCGDKIFGGLARRAAYIQDLRQSTGKTSPVFALSGGYEFLPEAGPAPTREKLQALAKAYTAINFDLGLLVPREAQAMREAGAVLPGQWITPEVVTQTDLPLPGGGNVGIVLFPLLKPGDKEPPRDLLEQINRAVKSLQRRSNIVVGLSPWGYFPELAYLRNDEAVLPDILLGSGPGPGFRGILAADGRSYWLRAYPLGKALNRVEILNWPKHDADFQWREDVDIRALNVGLTEHVREDPAINALFEGMDTN